MVTIEHILFHNFASKVDFRGSQMGWFYRYLFGLILAKALGKKSLDMTFLVVTIGTNHPTVAKCLVDFLLTTDNSSHLCTLLI